MHDLARQTQQIATAKAAPNQAALGLKPIIQLTGKTAAATKATGATAISARFAIARPRWLTGANQNRMLSAASVAAPSKYNAARMRQTVGESGSPNFADASQGAT